MSADPDRPRLRDGTKSVADRIDDLEDRTDSQDERLDQLERDKALVLGICGAVGTLVGFALAILTIWASWKT